MRKIWSIFAIGVLGLAPVTLRAETLTDALISAYRNSHLLEQNQAVLRAADEDFATAVGSLMPTVTFAAGITAEGESLVESGRVFRGGSFVTINGQQPFDTSSFLQLTASMNLFDFGRRQFNINLQKELVQFSRQNLVSAEQTILFDAVRAYVDMRLQSELVAAQEANVRLITQDLRAANDRFEVGEVTRTDVALAEAQLASANSALASAQGNYNVARETYKAKIGHYPPKLSGLPKIPATAKSVEAARDIALRTNPQVLAAQHQSKAADIAVDAARADMRPSIDGQARLRQDFQGDTLGGDTNGKLFFGTSQSSVGETVGITLSQTIYQGGQLSSALRKSIASQQRFKSVLMQTGVDVTLQVGQAWSNILVSNASIVAGDEQIRAAQAAYDGVKQEAELGSRTTLDVLDAEQNLLSARANRLQAGANLYVSHYQLLQAMGLLTADHLKLGIPTFDPTAYFNAVKNAPATTARGAKLDRILKTLGK